MSSAAYNADPGLRWSALAPALTSGMQYAHEHRHPRPDQPYYALGRACHVAVLQPSLMLGWPMVPPEYLTPSGAVSAKADAKAWLAEMAGRGIEPMGQGDMATALGVQAAVAAHPVAAETLAQCGRREVPVYAEIAGVGAVKACPDAYDPQTGLIADLKMSGNRSRGAFGVRGCITTIVHLHYAGQLAWYSRVLRAAGQPVGEWRIIFADPKAPHDIIVLSLGEEWQEYGEELVDRALAVRADVLAGKIDGQAPALVPAVLPEYLQETETGTDLEFGEEA